MSSNLSFNSNEKIAVTNDMDFYVDGFAMRVYDNSLWCDGGAYDDFYVREIPELEAADDYEAEVEITITAKDLERMAFFAANYEDTSEE